MKWPLPDGGGDPEAKADRSSMGWWRRSRRMLSVSGERGVREGTTTAGASSEPCRTLEEATRWIRGMAGMDVGAAAAPRERPLRSSRWLVPAPVPPPPRALEEGSMPVVRIPL